jgi:O-antigen ligase
MLWILTLFLFYVLHYYVGPKNKEMLPYSMISQGVIVICIILWLADLSFDRSMHLFILSASIATVIASVYYLYNSLDKIWIISSRLGLTDKSLPNVNFISQTVFIFSTLTLYQAFFKDKNKKIYIILFVIQLIFILLSGTKRAIIGLPVFYIIFMFIKNKKSFFRFALPLIIIIGLFIYLIFYTELLYNIVGERLEGMLYALGIVQNDSFNIGDNSTNIRKDLFNSAMNMIPDTPIFGYGFGYFETHSGLNTKVQTFHSHNNYLEIFLSYGIFGFMLYYNMFIRTTLRLIKRKSKTIIRYLFLTFFLVLFIIIEPSSVTFSFMPTYYLYLYFAYMYSWERDYNSLENTIINSRK